MSEPESPCSAQGVSEKGGIGRNNSLTDFDEDGPSWVVDWGWSDDEQDCTIWSPEDDKHYEWYLEHCAESYSESEQSSLPFSRSELAYLATDPPHNHCPYVINGKRDQFTQYKPPGGKTNLIQELDWSLPKGQKFGFPSKAIPKPEPEKSASPAPEPVPETSTPEADEIPIQFIREETVGPAMETAKQFRQGKYKMIVELMYYQVKTFATKLKTNYG